MIRVTEVIHFLTEDKFNQVPAPILEAAQERGNAGHKRLENFFLTSERGRAKFPPDSLEGLMRQTLAYLPSFTKAIPEKEYVKGKLVGHPDLVTEPFIGDYKFTDKRPDTCALQLVGYEDIVDEGEKELYLFHIPGDVIITYKLIDSTKPILRAFFFKCLAAHDAIQNDLFAKAELMYEWSMIVSTTALWQPVCTIMPANIIKGNSDLVNAGLAINVLSELEDKLKRIKSEIARYMADNDIKSIEAGDTMYYLSTKKTAQYNVPADVAAKLKMVKEKYKTGDVEGAPFLRSMPKRKVTE